MCILMIYPGFVPCIKAVLCTSKPQRKTRREVQYWHVTHPTWYYKASLYDFIPPSISLLSFCLIFPSGAALILSYTPSRYLSSSFLSTSLSSSVSLSLRHVISLSISNLLPVPFCSFRFHNISTPSFHFDILPSLHLLAASMNTSLVSTPLYLSLPYLDLPLLLSMHAYLSVSALSPQSQWARLSRGRARREKWTWNGKLFISDSSAAALSNRPVPPH